MLVHVECGVSGGRIFSLFLWKSGRVECVVFPGRVDLIPVVTVVCSRVDAAVGRGAWLGGGGGMTSRKELIGWCLQGVGHVRVGGIGMACVPVAVAGARVCQTQTGYMLVYEGLRGGRICCPCES